MCLASKSAVVRWYHKLRASGGSGIVGGDALGCWHDAKAVASFEHLAARGLVKIRAIDDDPEVIATYARADIDDEWTMADSICGCAGYRDSTDARENAYVPGMMGAAVELWKTLSIGQPLSI